LLLLTLVWFSNEQDERGNQNAITTPSNHLYFNVVMFQPDSSQLILNNPIICIAFLGRHLPLGALRWSKKLNEIEDDP